MLCNTCAYDNDRSHCVVPSFGDIVECSGYVSKEYNRGYIIPYNFSLNTRKGFNAIYGLMKLTQCNMANAITFIINARRKACYVILSVCNKVEKENNDIVKFLYGGA